MNETSSFSSEYPKKLKLSLELEILVRTPESEEYFVAQKLLEDGSSKAVPTIGFLADLFDLFNFEANLGVQSISGWTHDQIKKVLVAS